VLNVASRILTVSALNQLIRLRLEEGFPEIWIEGEISNLRIPPSGHVYLTLKDEASQLRAVVFRSSGRAIKFIPKNGMHVLCRGHVSVYEPRGEYQLIIGLMEPRGIGALQLAFDQLKEKLFKEGLFDSGRKRPLPEFPKRIGIVTSPTGAAIRDMLNVLRRRFAHVEVLLNPVPVQGEGAAAAIAQAIRELNDHGGLDVIIVGRGSLEDLWAFNEENVARSISESRIPVISAVGHEIDYTISDMVADLRAPTPSAAAELVVQSKTELARRVVSSTERLSAAVRACLRSARGELDRKTVALKDPRTFIQRGFLRTDELDARLKNGISITVRSHRKHLSHLRDVLHYQSPVERLRRIFQGIEQAFIRLGQAVHHVLKEDRSRLVSGVGRLNSLSPLAVLGRGYSLAYRLPDMRLLRRVEDVSRGDKIQVRLAVGKMRCEVHEIEKGTGNAAEV
jgi:exodeoxyribonuclease VII large subunit